MNNLEPFIAAMYPSTLRVLSLWISPAFQFIYVEIDVEEYMREKYDARIIKERYF